jgi:hypothetical protein
VLDLQLGQIDAQIETLESVIGESAAELTRLEDAIARTPLNAITLGSLQRDYENIRAQYDSAIARLAQASTGERIELTSRGQRITLIEAAASRANRHAPTAKLIAAAGLAAGVGLAVGLFVLLEILNRTVRRPVEISRALGIEPLATVPYISTRSERLQADRPARRRAPAGDRGAARRASGRSTPIFMPLDQLISEVADRFGLA